MLDKQESISMALWLDKCPALEAPFRQTRTDAHPPVTGRGEAGGLGAKGYIPVMKIDDGHP